MTGFSCILSQLSMGWDGCDPVVEDLSLEIDFENGKTIIPVMGRSGQGKSTFLYVISALKWPAGGSVEWNFPDEESRHRWCVGGKGLTEKEVTRLRRVRFGFAFQDSTLSLQLTVRENLEYPLRMRHTPLEETKKRAARMLEQLELPNSYGERFPLELSGGERQRVALGQAMIDEPTVLFADEPGGNLDIVSRKHILEVLREWSQEGERVVFLITHHLGDAEELGVDEVLLIDKDNKKCGPCALDEVERRLMVHQ